MLFRLSNYNDHDFLPRGSSTITPRDQWTTALRGPYLLMVHGYNNDVSDADAKFLPVSNLFDDTTRIGYYWENSSSYLHGRARSKRAAISLKNFLVKNFTPQEARQLTIVAHSMGARVVLECFRRLFDDSSAPVIKPKNLILWSPAVDDDEIVKGDQFYNATKLPRRVWVMYSKRDDVLKNLYPLGDMEEALGWHGPDLSEGPVAPNVRSVNCTSYIDEHSKWWKSQKALKTLRSLVDTGELP